MGERDALLLLEELNRLASVALKMKKMRPRSALADCHGQLSLSVSMTGQPTGKGPQLLRVAETGSGA